MNPQRKGPTVTAAFLVAGTLAVGLAGCSPSTVVEVPEQLQASLLAIGSLPPELELAQRMVIRTCMAEAGFELPFDSSPPHDTGGALIVMEGLFSSEESARAAGYRSTRIDEVGPIDLYEANLSSSQATEYRVAYSGGDDADEARITLGNGTIVGRSTEGCTAEADIAVFGSVENTLKAQNFINEVLAQAATYVSEIGGELAPILTDYQTCMADVGIAVDGLNAADVAATEFGKYRSVSEPPSAEEQTMAANDYECQTESGIASKLNEIFLSKSSAWVVQNEGTIIGTREIVDEAKQRAQSIIAAA